MVFLSSMTLVLGIPFAVVTLPSAPIPHILRRHVNHLFASRALLYATAVILSLLPPAFARAISDVLMLLAFLGTFTVPGESDSPRTSRHILKLFSRAAFFLFSRLNF